jgi:hypothetical protein
MTIRDINTALRAEGIQGSLRRGRGYFYFTGADFDSCFSTSVYVFRLEGFTLAQWISEAKQMIAAAR